MTCQRQEDGSPTVLIERFAETTSASVELIAVEVCFLENAVNGKYVLGPTMANMQPDVDRESCSPAWSLSANSHSLHFSGASPIKEVIL